MTWQLPTRIETVVLMLALNRLGAVQNPLIPLYGKREVGFALRQTRAQLFLVPSQWRGTAHGAMAGQLQAEIGNGLRVLLTDDGLPEADPSALAPPPTVSSTGPSPVRWIFYTSGTTADPKGVCHTDESICAAGNALVVQHALVAADVGSIAFPIAHAGGAQYLASMFQAGFPAVLLERFVPADSLRVMRRHAVTIVGGGTAFYRALLDEQRRQPQTPVLPTLRKLTGGGSAKPPQLFDDARQELGAPILHGFGMTESPCVTMGALADSDEQLAFTEGAPVPGMQRPDRAYRRVAGAGVGGRRDRVPRGARHRWIRRSPIDRSIVHGRRLAAERGPRAPSGRRSSGRHRPQQGRHHPQGRERLGA